MAGPALRAADALLPIRVHIAALAVLNRGYVLAVKFNPAQPRVPAGSPDGGQWTGGGDGVVRVADNRKTSWAPVDLRQEDLRGGHGFRDHVGKSDEQLIQTLQGKKYEGYVISVYAVAEGSFSSAESANDFVNQTLRSDPARVLAVANGETDGDVAIVKRFGYPTGKEAFRPEPLEFPEAEPFIRPAYEVKVIIRHDGRRPNGFIVKTAFPSNARTWQ